MSQMCSKTIHVLCEVVEGLISEEREETQEGIII